MPKQGNTFEGGLNMDISDLMLPQNMMRNCKNMRMLDLDGTSYAITTIKGTESKFNLSTGYIPISSKQYGEILYIVSGKLILGSQTQFETVEIGSYPSPEYGAQDPTINTLQYRPFNNLDDSAFIVDFFTLTIGEFVDLEVQPDYDGSINLIITAEDNSPRIVNSKFNKDFELIATRPGSNSNDYTSASVDTETRLVLRSQKILNVAYAGIENGGKLQYGNYVYIFKYTTDDFNETDIVNQSGICSIFEGYETNKLAGGAIAETTKRVRLTLSNVDTDFAYVKVYFKFNTGEDANVGNVFEFTNPIAISGRSTFEFIHDGYEDTVEVSEDVINVDFTVFDSIKTITQVDGRLILGGVKEASTNFQEFATDAQTVTARETAQILGLDSPYENSENIYNFLSHFSAESYPYGIVFIMNDGSLSPVFPVQGYDEYNWTNLTTEQQDDIKAKGLLRFSSIEQNHFNTILKTIPKGVSFDLSNITQSLKDKTIGCFFVRGERKRDLLSQGVLIPTLRVPPIDFTRDEQIDNLNDDGNYYDDFSNLTDYKNFPILDNVIEPWTRIDQGVGDDDTVITKDGTNRVAVSGESVGYMPSVIKNFDIPAIVSATPVKDPTAWAYMSADYILNEARYITSLQRSNLGFTQWSQLRLKALAIGKILNKWKDTGVQEGSAFGVDTSLLYDFFQYVANFSGSAVSDEIDDIDYVPAATFSTGHEFISGLSVRFRQDGNHHFQARSLADAYFGIKATIDSAVSDSDSPYNQPTRSFTYDQTDGPAYANIDTIEKRGYLISIYPRLSGLPIDDINQLYDTVDGISYKQIGDRMTWEDITGNIKVFGGDCYVGKVYKRINLSGYDDPKEPSDILGKPAAYAADLSADNINQGITLSFVQECEYNPALRLPYIANLSDSEKRTFYPYRNNADYIKYREYRLAESNKTNQGYSETERPKTHVAIPSNAPFIASNFFTRIIHSEKHVPNAFQNGYRSYIGINHKDYDPDMGEIVRLFTHRNQLLIVFEHGIGIGPISERIQTGSDSAGAIFVEPSGVLPPNLGFASRYIGSQNGNAIIQTPSSIYGIDQSKHKIWQFREGLLVISDLGFQHILDKAVLTNPRLGYDPDYVYKLNTGFTL